MHNPIGIALKENLHIMPTDGYFGDPMLLFHEGVYHVFFTRLTSCGDMCWGHFATSDLVSWVEYPDPIGIGEAGTYDEHSVLSGSVVRKDDMFWLFYCGVNRHNQMTILRASSRDLITWEKEYLPLLERTPDWYSIDVTWRDPCVFWDPSAQLYRMALCAHRPAQENIAFPGALAMASSTDFDHWVLEAPAWLPDVGTVVECPDIFQAGEHWVLTYFWHETRSRYADTPLGPWKRPRVEAPDYFDFFAGRSVSDGKRRLLFAWIPRKDSDCAQRTWGGEMALPREWRFLPEGSTETRCAEEILQYCHARGSVASQEHFQAVVGEWKQTQNHLCCEGGGQPILPAPPRDYLLETTIHFLSDTSSVILLLRCHADRERPGAGMALGYQLILDAVENVIRLRYHYQWDQQNDIACIPYTFGKAEKLELFLHRDILEVFIGKKKSMVCRLLQHVHGKVSLCVLDGPVSFEDIAIYPIVGM